MLWKQLDVCGTRGSRWKYVRVCQSFLRDMLVEAHLIGGNNGSFHFHQQWKLPSILVEASTNIHGSKATPSNFYHGSFLGSRLKMGKMWRVRSQSAKLLFSKVQKLCAQLWVSGR